MDTVQQALGTISGGRVLDVATGNGNFVDILSENLRDYTGIMRERVRAIGFHSATILIAVGRK